MENLIKALQIFLKYANHEFPTNCEHDYLFVCGIDSKKVSEEDIKELDRLGFYVDSDDDSVFISYIYGSC